MHDLRQTLNYAKYMDLLGWKVEKVSNNYIYIKRLPFLGSIAKFQRPTKKITLEQINKIVKMYRVFTFNIEPLDQEDEDYCVNELGFAKTKSTSIPSKTIHINLKQSDNELMDNMHYKTRYNIKLAKRRGVSVSSSKDIEKFSEFWNHSARKRGMYIPLKKEIYAIYKAFGKNAEIINAEFDNGVVAAVLILYTREKSYYMYAASTDIGNRNQAPSLLVWEAIQRSKKRKKKIFDLEGVYDERYPIKSWKGFTRFKKSFGGEVVEYPGVVRKLYFPLIGSL